MAFLLGISKSHIPDQFISFRFVGITYGDAVGAGFPLGSSAIAALRLIWRRHGHTHVHSAAWWTVGKGKVSLPEVSRKRESCLYRSILSIFLFFKC